MHTWMREGRTDAGWMDRLYDWTVTECQSFIAQPCFFVRKLNTMYWFGFSIQMRASQLEVINICYTVKVTTELI